ncbi:DUF1378 family protein [Escherichia coli]
MLYFCTVVCVLYLLSGGYRAMRLLYGGLCAVSPFGWIPGHA